MPDGSVCAESSLSGSPGRREGRGEALQEGGGSAQAAVRSPGAVQTGGGGGGAQQARGLPEQRLVVTTLHLGEDQRLQHAGHVPSLRLHAVMENRRKVTLKARQFSPLKY